jgi:hypothetical protein
MNMTKHKEFDGGGSKPIRYCVKVTATATDNGFEGKAYWRFLEGSCSVELQIKNGKFSATNFKVQHKSSIHERALQERKLAQDEVTYLESLFKKTIES